MTASALFRPLEFAGLSLPNRVAMCPMGTGLPDEEGFVTDETIAYYARRAAGGVGMISLEASLIAPESFVVGPELRLHDERFVPGLRRLSDAVHDHGVPVGIQMWHPGRQTLKGTPIAPSAIPLSPRTPVPHALTRAEIERLIGLYAAAAVNCRAAGMDFVEVHAAHCYLPCEFLSPLSNQRDDEYGGSLENRARFMLEIVRAVRGAAGEDFPLLFRISGDECAEGGFTIDDAVVVAGWLADAGVAAISVSAGNWYALHMTIPPMSMPHGCLLPYAAAIRRAVDVPVIAAGRLDDPALAERVVADGQADVVAVGRGLIADPDWPAKVRDGRLDDIRPCIACNACVELVAHGEEARCAVNPAVGRDSSFAITPAASPRRVMVIGSGPAGMEAARIARLRGHVVSIWERDPELGGKLDVASRAPSKHEVLRFRDYQARVLRELGVEISLGSEVGAAEVDREDPEIVILAAGAEPLIPPIPGIDLPHVVDAQEILLGRVAIADDERVAVIGGSATGCETAEFLCRSAGAVSVVEMLPRIGRGVEQIMRRQMLAELREQGVSILTGATVTRIEPGRVIYEGEDGAPGEIACDRVALAIGWRPRGAALAAAINRPQVHVIGDAERPADFVAAINAGADAGLAV
jgi:2,4-dienoyl-CoA reductase-like NADH-dependent reductase (Old Yellow Enzyme family)/thioredoxin reductase